MSHSLSMRFPKAVHRLRVLEAVGALTVAGLLLRILPFRMVMKLVGSGAARAGENMVCRPATDPVAAAVGRAVNSAAARLPWRSRCLIRALAGRAMLMRRGVPSTLVLGVTKKMEELQAHAWLVAGGGSVCGGREAARFQPIAAFREHGPRSLRTD